MGVMPDDLKTAWLPSEYQARTNVEYCILVVSVTSENSQLQNVSVHRIWQEASSLRKPLTCQHCLLQTCGNDNDTTVSDLWE